MKVVKIKDGLYCIIPEDGMHLTHSEMLEGEERVFCCSAYELREDDASLWTEWTEEQKAEYESAKN